MPQRFEPADHGGGIDAAIARFGGQRGDWLDLSTGINPRPYPMPALPPDAWTALPDQALFTDLEQAARAFWQVPDAAAVLVAPGASALIARIPALAPAGRVAIQGPTYNEHARAFAAAGWQVGDAGGDAAVVVHPNNPDGRLHDAPAAPLTVIDESFGDIAPDTTHMAGAATAGRLILKSFGKFWGLAGLRLGFAIGDPALVGRLGQMIGPWAVSGPALVTGAVALRDTVWADATRHRLAQDAARLDGMMQAKGAELVGGTPLFRLYHVDDARGWHDRLAAGHVLTRVFPYSRHWIRLGLPDGAGWDHLQKVLG